MTHLSPTLALRRLKILSKGVSVYDEKFHYGVNIIRGTNSSGKSTISDFIFYVLGGDSSEWKPEAERCDEVVAEVEINLKAITLKRQISVDGKKPLWIFFDTFEVATQSAFEGWQVFSMTRSEGKESASQILFRALEMPEIRTDTENNITMHQLLRLLYVDQLSNVQSLMRDENFDSAVIRQTVGDLLLGIYDDDLYTNLKKLRASEKALDSVEGQLKALNLAVGDAQIEVDAEKLANRIVALEAELKTTEAKIAEAIQRNDTGSNAASFGIDKLADDLRSAQKELALERQKSEDLTLEIHDSELFIDELEKRLSALNESIAARQAFGGLSLSHCPHCLSELQPPPTHQACPLCKQDSTDKSADARAIRMKQDLDQQINESRQLLNDKKTELQRSGLSLGSLELRYKLTRSDYEEAVVRVRSSRDAGLDELFIAKGKLAAEIENLARQARVAGLVDSLKKKRSELQDDIALLKRSVEKLKQGQDARRIEAHRIAEHFTKLFLQSDLNREGEFAVCKNVLIDFANNSFAIDKRNKFSASSIVLLKNSIHFGLFFASLKLPFMRYPRFILCDDIEDKGMEEERSRNFQRLVVKMSDQVQTAHQIIFTTSMIAPELNNSDYCVGPEYDQARKSLNFFNRS